MNQPITNSNIKLLFKQSKRAKRIRLELDGHRFNVVAPMGASNIKQLNFVFEHWRWLKRHAKPRPLHVGLDALDTVPLWGEQYQLVCQVGITFDYQVCEKDKILYLTFAQNMPLDYFDAALKNALGNIYYLESAKVLKESIIPTYCHTTFTPSKVRFKWMSTQWGSLSPANAMSLNLTLTLAPKAMLEYVYVHELAHLRYKSHGIRFWQLVEKIKPDYKHQEDWLRRDGGDLMAWVQRNLL